MFTPPKTNFAMEKDNKYKFNGDVGKAEPTSSCDGYEPIAIWDFLRSLSKLG